MQSSSAAAGKLPRCELLSSPVISERADANIKSQTYTTISICIGIAFELSSGPLMIPIRIIYNSKFPFVRIYNFLSSGLVMVHIRRIYISRLPFGIFLRF